MLTVLQYVVLYPHMSSQTRLAAAPPPPLLRLGVGGAHEVATDCERGYIGGIGEEGLGVGMIKHILLCMIISKQFLTFKKINVVLVCTI